MSSLVPLAKNLSLLSAIFNLFRASQVLFPGEIILEEAKEFSYNFLQQKLEKNQFLDKCLISKHLPNEIKNGLEMPWYASLPRVETRFYIKNYGVDDIWIGKSLYRMPEINNETYLELAKLDYNRCQALHKMEWDHMQKWYEDFNLEEFGITKKDLLLVFFLATASIFEPEKSEERTAWIKSMIISNILSTYYSIKEAESSEQRIMPKDGKGYKNIQRIISILFEALRQFNKNAQHRVGTDTSDLLYEAWGVWLKKLGEGAEDQRQVELLVRTINICGGHMISKDILFHQEYHTISALTDKICHQLQGFESEKVIGMEGMKKTKYREIEKDMQLLLKLVLEDASNGISKDIKHTFLLVVKTFYYRAYFTTEQIENHVSKVLFEQVV